MFSFPGKELQGRWRNLRTCFRREVNKQRQEEASGQTSKKRRKYVYYDQLLFLLPTMEDLPPISETTTSLTQGDNSETEDYPEVIQTTDQSQVDAVNNGSQAGTTPTQQPTNIMLTKKPSQGQTKKNPNYVESLLTILKEKKDKHIDEDKYFLLSLVPSFRKLSDVQKLEAKIEFLTTLKRLTQSNQGQNDNCAQRQETWPSCRPQGFAGNDVSQQNSSHNHKVENSPSRSSTPDSESKYG